MMRQAYHAPSALEAEALLEALAKELGKTHPGAAVSLREDGRHQATMGPRRQPPRRRTSPEPTSKSPVVGFTAAFGRVGPRPPSSRSWRGA
jgi:hypothetical protein